MSSNYQRNQSGLLPRTVIEPSISIWTAKASDILEKVTRARAALYK